MTKYLPLLGLALIWGISKFPDRTRFFLTFPTPFPWTLSSVLLILVFMYFGTNFLLVWLFKFSEGVGGILLSFVGYVSVLYALLGWFLVYKSDVPFKQFLNPGGNIPIALFWGTRLCCVVAIILSLFAVFKGTIGHFVQSFDTPFYARSWQVFVVFLLFAVFVMPPIEEAIFRGMLYPPLVLKIGSTGAIYLSSLTFALFHGDRFFWALLTGMILAYAYHRTSSLIPCIMFHAFYNGWSISTEYADISYQKAFGFSVYDTYAFWVVGGVTLLGYILSDWQLWEQRRKVREQSAATNTGVASGGSI